MGKRVMVVEDSALARTMLRDILVTAGHTVVAEVSGGEESVQAYQSLKPDLVLMDIVLQNRNGIAAAAEILALDKDARIVMMSVLGDIPLIQAAFSVGVKDFIQKPFQAEKILKILEEDGQ